MNGVSTLTGTGRWFAAAFKTYRSAFGTVLRANQRKIFMTTYFVSPLAAVPQALFSPFFIVANSHSSVAARLLAALVVTMTWQVWFMSQRGLLPAVRGLSALSVSMDHVQTAVCEAIRLAILAWPLLPLCIVLVVIDTDGLAAPAVSSMFFLVGVASLATYLHGRWVNERRRRPRRSRWGVLAQQAAYDVFSWAQVSIAVRHLLGLLALSIATAISTSGGQRAWIPTFFATGTLAAFLPLRGIIDHGERQLATRAPFIIASPGIGDLERLRIMFMGGAFVLIAAVLGLGAPSVGTNARAAIMLPVFAAAVSGLFALARACQVPRVLEPAIMGIPLIITLATLHS